MEPPFGPRPNLELLEKNCFLRRFHRKATRSIVTPDKKNLGGLGTPDKSYPGGSSPRRKTPGASLPGGSWTRTRVGASYSLLLFVPTIPSRLLPEEPPETPEPILQPLLATNRTESGFLPGFHRTVMVLFCLSLYWYHPLIGNR